MDYALNRRLISSWGIVPVLFLVIGGITGAVGFVLLITSVFEDDPFTALLARLWVLVVGVVLFVAGQIWNSILKARRPKGEQVDGQVQEEVKQLYGKALDKHGITEEMVQRAPPLVFGGYVLDEKEVTKLFSMKLMKTSGNLARETLTEVSSTTALASVMSGSVIPVDNIATVKYVQAGDSIIRSALAEYTIFLFSEEKVFVYTRQFSLIDPEIKESAQVYSYRDIVSISSETSKYGSHTFIVKVSGGITLEVPSSSSAVGDIKGSVTAFMQLVREKKSM
jgi:hypothetical protein